MKIIFLILFLHRIHFYSIFNFIDNLLAIRDADTEINEYPGYTAQAMTSASILLAPIPGLIADVYFPRTQVISFCLLLSFIGSSIQSLFHTIYELNIVDVPAVVYWVVSHTSCHSFDSRIIGDICSSSPSWTRPDGRSR